MVFPENTFVITKIEPSLFHVGTLWDCVDSDGYAMQIAIDPLDNIRVRRAKDAGVPRGPWTTLYEESLDNLQGVETYGDLKTHLESVGFAFADGLELTLRATL